MAAAEFRSPDRRLSDSPIPRENPLLSPTLNNRRPARRGSARAVFGLLRVYHPLG